jgi:hypothetical protein
MAYAIITMDSFSADDLGHAARVTDLFSVIDFVLMGAEWGSGRVPDLATLASQFTIANRKRTF